MDQRAARRTICAALAAHRCVRQPTGCLGQDGIDSSEAVWGGVAGCKFALEEKVQNLTSLEATFPAMWCLLLLYKHCLTLSFMALPTKVCNFSGPKAD